MTTTQTIQRIIRPLVICGPSGVGKGTLVTRLLSEYKDCFGFSVSHTTRKPRQGEVDGVHYHFIEKEQMLKEIEQNKFIEYAHVHSNLYGTSFKAVKDVSDQGKCCILDIDTQGAYSVVKRSELHPFVVFIMPPSFDELEKRLRGRGTETEDKIQLRIKNGRDEMEQAQQNKDGIFNCIIVNDNLDSAYEQLKQAIQSNIGLQLKAGGGCSSKSE